MEITLLHYTPLDVCAHAIRTCWQSFDKGDEGGEKDKALIDRVGNKFKHASTMEHLVYTFYIQGVSRALLQELARHRLASPSVKSTRYTLKELKETEPFAEDDYEGAERFIVLTKNALVDSASIKALNNLQAILKSGVSNDLAKFCLPESYKTELTWTINARSLQNFLTLRSNKAALWEIRKMAYALYGSLPEEHQYLFETCLYKEKANS
ncbi:MAG TPA: FAD-dependent thymidylate synthase [Epsilonproteobacteria bacterium]|nr:FAD-dependent thymidylate synthase [Campylobacterota bacterium]